MQFYEWQGKLFGGGTTPPLFDEMVVRVGEYYYAIDTLEFLQAGGEGGPGIIALTLGGQVPIAVTTKTDGQRAYERSQAGEGVAP